MAETKGSPPISTRLEPIANLAEKFADSPLTTLAHHIDIDWVREAHRRTRKDGARGIDGQSADEYAADLEGNLARLLERAKSGSYRAPAVRRTYIPKANGERRPLGIPTFEDKVLQRAVAMALEAVYEREFLDCSYGFRPGRSAHQALDALREQAIKKAGGWAIEVDIRKYFETIDHRQLQEVLRQRIRDGVIGRLVGKWLSAGVMEDGELQRSGAGTPQGGVISPLLANIYLHTVLDVWFEKEVRPRLRGRAYLTRYADDAVMLFEYEEDARRVMDVLPKRFERYGLALHPDKTRVVPFKRPDRSGRNDDDPRGGSAARTFDFLGFHHPLGPEPQRQLGGEDSNGQGPLPADAREHRAVVQAPSACAPGSAAADAQRQAARPLRLLPPDRQRGAAMGPAVQGGAYLVAMVESPLATRPPHLADDEPAAPAIPAGHADSSTARVANP